MIERLGRIASRIAFIIVVFAYINDPIRRAKRRVRSLRNGEPLIRNGRRHVKSGWWRGL